MATVRDGMAENIETVRAYADASSSEWTVETDGRTLYFWDDNEIQKVIDRHRIDFTHVDMLPVQSYSSGTVVYLEYRAPYQNIESGTAVFKIENVDGTISGYTMDYVRGVATFSTDQGGTAYYVTGRTYDLYGAAADIWRVKASHAAEMVDFSTDGHSVKRSNLASACLSMADYYGRKSSGEGQRTVKLTRDDL